ncbi:MAG: UvrD-helicase domain-containing protein [Clostridiales bacterium]|nr:UvrD-helicase domain-containing protein [Clostridiales bacterium]
MVKFSDEQLKIIDAPRSNILVSAAAGSGKTTVLSQRITSKIINRELQIDELLVVTFTKDAAAHMRKKIEENLRKALLEGGADRKYIKAQIDKIPGAYIQTMNSFCNRVVSEAGHMSSAANVMEPGSTVLDETSLQILRKQSANEAVMAVYDGIAEGRISGNEREDFLNLVFSMGDGKNEGPVADAVEKAYLKLRSLPDYLDIIDGIIAHRNETDESKTLVGLSEFISLNDSLIRKACKCSDSSAAMVDNLTIKDSSKDDLRAVILTVGNAASAYMEQADKCANDEDRIKAVNDFFDRVFNESDPSTYPRLYNKSEFKDPLFMKEFGPIAAVCCINIRNHKAAGHKCSSPWGFNESAAPHELNDDFDVFGLKDPDELMSMQVRRTSCARAFAALLKDMDARFDAHKKKLRGIDFSDQEHMCLRVLKTPEARDLYRDRFKEIYIDEYQDNTSLQDTVVAMISNGNVFCVGDVKQSIYKFRNANPSMFIRKSEEYRDDPSKGNLMGLNCNFRSTPQILSFVNEIFGQLMSGGAAEIDYDRDGHELNPSPTAKDGSLPEVIIINSKRTDKTISDDEGVVNEIKQIELIVAEIGKKVMEYHDRGYAYKDIFVLTRTNNSARAAADHLRSFDIPARCIDKKPLFSDNEITGICNLIKVLANEYRDECLAGVMLACYSFSNFMLDELAEIISFSSYELRKMNLIIKVRNYAVNGPVEELRDRCERFLDALDELRSESVIRDISELVELIYSRTGIKATLVENTPYEVDKLTLFKNWLVSNFLRRGSDLTEVAGVIEQMQSRLEDDASIEYDLGGEDLVRCMSYHKSKGLENKCVIVADVDSSNKTDTNEFISFKAGNVLSPEEPNGPQFVVDDYDDSVSVTTTSAEKAVVKQIDKLEATAEDMRLLYVALTRAEENLCFIRRMDLDSDSLMKNVINPLTQEGKYLSRDFYLKCSGIANMMLSVLLRMNNPELAHICGVEGTFQYNSLFDGVKVTVKTAMDVVCDEVPEVEEKASETESSGEEKHDDSADRRGQVIYASTGSDSAGMPVFAPYRYEDAMRSPAKTSVSAMKREEDDFYSRDSGNELKTAINMLVPDTEHYIGVDSGLSGAALGTAVHKTMNFIDLEKLSEDASAADELDALVDEGILSSRERDAVSRFADNIKLFASSDLGKALVSADKAGRAEFEKTLVCAIRINPERDDYKLVQGTLDAMYTDDDGKAVIIDYKTDYLKMDGEDEIVDEVKKRHAEQLELYAAAVEASGLPVKARYVYLLRKNMAIEV